MASSIGEIKNVHLRRLAMVAFLPVLVFVCVATLFIAVALAAKDGMSEWAAQVRMLVATMRDSWRGGQ